MSKPNIVYLDVWTGDPARARELVAARYPDADLVELSHRELRDGGWKGQVQAFRRLNGQALVFFFESFADSKQTELIRCSGLLHSCGETVVLSRMGESYVYAHRDWLWALPRLAFSLLADACIFVFWLTYLKFLSLRGKRVGKSPVAVPEIIYLFPYPLDPLIAGGAVTHIRGFLTGLAANRTPCRIFSSVALPGTAFQTETIPPQRRVYAFWESLALAYNLRFVKAVQQELGRQQPSLLLYQRHGRFSVAGAVLARRMSVPLVLEYNGSEVWMADYWHPARFRTWLRLCEQVMLNCASLVVVVSDALKDELIGRGVPANHVLVNPNAVDTEYFHPGCGGEQVRKELGFSSREVVVEFVGTFSYWHGIAVLQYGIECLLQNDKLDRLRFLLVGGGPLHSEIREYLRQYEASGKVIFTGLVSHDKVRAYLDAADILVSPHVPMPDGRPFFGSPTKLFEYMSMGKAIVASDLDQLAKVLRHNETGILVQPGDASQFVEAVQLLAADSHLRASLGRRSREVAIECHTWTHNARSVLAAMRDVSLHVPNESLGEPAVSERG